MTIILTFLYLLRPPSNSLSMILSVSIYIFIYVSEHIILSLYIYICVVFSLSLSITLSVSLTHSNSPFYLPPCMTYFRHYTGDGMKGDFLPKFANGMTLVTLSAARKGSLEALLNTPNAPTLLIILRY